MKQVKFFRPNWSQINKAIESYSLKELREQQKKMNDTIQKKINLAFQAKRNKEAADKLKALKDLPIDSDVYYTGNSPDISFGSKGFKRKDGRKYMTVSFEGKATWNVVYQNLQEQPTSDSQNSSHKITSRLNSALSTHQFNSNK